MGKLLVKDDEGDLLCAITSENKALRYIYFLQEGEPLDMDIPSRQFIKVGGSFEI